MTSAATAIEDAKIFASGQSGKKRHLTKNLTDIMEQIHDRSLVGVGEVVAVCGKNSVDYVRSLSNEELFPLGEKILKDIADDIIVLEEIKNRFRRSNRSVMGYKSFREFVEQNSRYSVRTIQNRLAEKNGKDLSKVNKETGNKYTRTGTTRTKATKVTVESAPEPETNVVESKPATEPTTETVLVDTSADRTLEGLSILARAYLHLKEAHDNYDFSKGPLDMSGLGELQDILRKKFRPRLENFAAVKRVETTSQAQSETIARLELELAEAKTELAEAKTEIERLTSLKNRIERADNPRTRKKGQHDSTSTSTSND